MSRRIIRIAVSACAVALLAVSATGCKKVAEKAAEEASEAAVESATGGKVELDEGKVSIETTGGQKVEVRAKTLPPDFPKSVPVEEDVKIVSSSSAPDGDRGMGYTLSYLTKTATKKAVADYKAQLVKKGWKIMMEAESEGTFYLSAETAKRQLSATIAPAEDEAPYKTLVNVVEVPLVK